MKLGDYYREHGESEHVAQVEDALTDRWQDTTEVGIACGKARVNNHYGRVVATPFVKNCLDYLAEEGRAEEGLKKLKRPMYGHKYKSVWRKPQGDDGE